MYSSRPDALLLTITSSAVLASFLLNEELGHLGRVGCALCLIGSLIIVLHAPEDKDVQTVEEILHLVIQPGVSILYLGLLHRFNTSARLPDVLFYCPRFLSGDDLYRRTSLWPLEPNCVYLHLLTRRLRFHHGCQRVWGCR